MPDLGEYAVEVLAAYAVSLLLLAAIIGISWRRYVKVRAALKEVESRG